MNDPTTKTSTKQLTILVAGGGLGGAALAQGLAQAGFDVRVFDRDAGPDARAQGFRISINAMGLDALRALKRIADRHNVDALMAVATSAVREAQNGGEFVRAARDEAGIDIQVIRGDEEARLIYLGARGSLDLGKRRVALFDLGGGSLEVILADAQELYYTASLKLGVIRLAEACPCSDPPSPRERAHNTTSGPTIRAPMASPSHHCHQSVAKRCHGAAPPRQRLKTPMVALTTVDTPAASAVNPRTSWGRSRDSRN